MSMAHAHKPSDAYVTVERRSHLLDVRVDVALRDLELAIGLDADGDGNVTWGEVRHRHDAIAALVIDRLRLAAAGDACPLALRGHRIDTHTDGAYAVVDLTGRCGSSGGALSIDYRLLFDVDPQHRGLVNVVDEGASRSLALSVDRPQAVVAGDGWFDQFVSYVREGALHIFGGFDHMLFLVGLLLPVVLVRAGDGRWLPVERLAPVAWNVFGIVTAFTIAHAVTLTLATIGLLEVPSRLVESIIALSIVLAALNNLRPVVRARWSIAFGFGLVHGLGFANVLSALSLPRDVLLIALVAFNVGVELAQLAVAAIVLPLAFMLRGTALYRPVVLVGGSTLIALLGLAWLFERAFEIELIP